MTDCKRHHGANQNRPTFLHRPGVKTRADCLGRAFGLDGNFGVSADPRLLDDPVGAFTAIRGLLAHPADAAPI